MESLKSVCFQEMWRIKNTSVPWCKKECSRAESGHQSVEMGPLKTKGTHLSSPQRRCKQLNCHGKHKVWELRMHLTALEGHLGKSLGGSHQERVELWAVLQVGHFPLQWGDRVSLGLYLMLVQSQFSMNHFISFMLSHPPTHTPLHTLKHPPKKFPETPHQPYFFVVTISWGSRRGHSFFQSFVKTVHILQTH